MIVFSVFVKLKKIDVTLRRQQAEFQAGRSCVDHIATLRIIIKQGIELQQSFYLLFVDYEKAFDRLWHEYIWEALQHKGVSDKLVNLIKAQ